MQGIRPERLTDTELLNHVYMRLDKPMPREWVVELWCRLNQRVNDSNFRPVFATPEPITPYGTPGQPATTAP